MLFFTQPFILPFLCHKSATSCRIDSSKVSNSKLKLDVYNCVKTEVTECTGPPQRQQKLGGIILGHPVSKQTESQALS